VAREHVQRPALALVEDVIRQVQTRDDINVPNPVNLARAVNRHRQKMRPREPSDKQFMLDVGYIGGDEFLVKDILTEDGERHIILATQIQLQHLQTATRWFMDGTFKIVRDPFMQLVSIHAFIRKSECVKQMPLAFILMSRRTKRVYVTVLGALIEAMAAPPAVEWIMMDFEIGNYDYHTYFLIRHKYL